MPFLNGYEAKLLAVLCVFISCRLGSLRLQATFTLGFQPWALGAIRLFDFNQRMLGAQ